MHRDSFNLAGKCLRDACRTLNAISHRKNKLRTRSYSKFDYYLTNVAICKLYEVYLENILALNKQIWIPHAVFDIDKLRRQRNHLVHGFDQSHDELVINYADATLPDQIKSLKKFLNRK